MKQPSFKIYPACPKPFGYQIVDQWAGIPVIRPRWWVRVLRVVSFHRFGYYTR